VQFHEWNSVISTSADTHRNPRVQIISLLDSQKEKGFRTSGACLHIHISSSKVKNMLKGGLQKKTNARHSGKLLNGFGFLAKCLLCFLDRETRFRQTDAELHDIHRNLANKILALCFSVESSYFSEK